ncbi:2-hydroxyacid dehydrogenase [Citreimonas sp.]|uniref:2-hydroxyacid dehydrogenase n=1 Tax=Citreimonas sp. TaxID=3036715 RepID=UPI004058C590
MIEPKMIGLVTTLGGIDLAGHYRPVFAQHAPELELRTPDEVDDRGAVRFVFTFRPADDAFDGLTGLRAIFSAGAGTDAIMACPSRPAHVPVFRVEDADQALQMAGYAAFHVHWHHRNMARYVVQQQRGEWSRVVKGLSPTYRLVGVLGFGHMGRAIARGLMALGYPVAGYSRRPPEPPEPGVEHFQGDGLDAFLARADMLVNVLPLTENTRGLIDAGFLGRLPAGAALIHMGRGGQVDEAALIAALDSGHLSGASLDVFEIEPLPPDDPVWRHPKILVTPHVASIPEPAFVVRAIRQRMRQIAGQDAPAG